MSTILGVMGTPQTALDDGTGAQDSIVIGGVWKNIEDIYVCISGAWHIVVERDICISSAWET